LNFGDHPALYSVIDLVKENKNQNLIVTKLIKNVKYTNNNRNSNVTYIINGEVIDALCSGLYLPISGGATALNIKNLGYSLISDETNMINDDFHFIEDSNIAKISPFNVIVKVNKETQYARQLFLPFSPTCLEKGDKFQAILYYTWENSIVTPTDSTSYFTLTLFPKGVKKLIIYTNLVFASKPTQVAVYKVNKKRKLLLSKELFSNVKDIKQIDDLFVIRWEIDEPKDTYILQRTLEKWS
jgi:hypothetical protein